MLTTEHTSDSAQGAGRNRTTRRLLRLAVILLSVMVGCDFPATTTNGSNASVTCGTIQILRYQPYKPLMAKSCFSQSLYVTGSANVSFEALENAALMADAMLRNRPDVRERLQTAGAVLAVFAEGENNCDLDYFSDLRGRYDINGNLQCEVGGLGGVPGRPASSCGELNALSAMYNDPFLRGSTHGQNICVHEIAHLFMNVGLSDSERRQILQRYEQIQRRPDAWLTTAGNEMFALINHQEFWAEMSMIYFNGSPRVPTWNHVGISGPDALKHHDRQTYNLLHGIYRGSADLR